MKVLSRKFRIEKWFLSHIPHHAAEYECVVCVCGMHYQRGWNSRTHNGGVVKSPVSVSRCCWGEAFPVTPALLWMAADTLKLLPLSNIRQQVRPWSKSHKERPSTVECFFLRTPLKWGHPSNNKDTFYFPKSSLGRRSHPGCSWLVCFAFTLPPRSWHMQNNCGSLE